MTTDEAIKHFGSVLKVAIELGIAPQGVYAWGENPPMARQYELEVKTNGALKAQRETEKAR